MPATETKISLKSGSKKTKKLGNKKKSKNKNPHFKSKMKKTESNPNIELKKSPEVRKDKQFRIVHKKNITAPKGSKFLNRIQLPKNSQIVSKAGRFSTSQSPAKTKSQLS
jgi:hypothetical protein